MFPFHVIKKDLSTLSTVLKSSINGLTAAQIYNEYQKITKPDQQVSKQYLQKTIRYGVAEGIIKINGYVPHTGPGKAPRRLTLSDINMTNDDWDTFIQLYRAEIVEETKAKLNKKKKAKLSTTKPCKASAPPVSTSSEKICDHFNETRENPNKQFVESFFINRVAQYLGDEKVRCLALTGPDYFRHVNKLFNTFTDELFIVENDNGVFNQILERAKDCPHYAANRVKLLNCNLEDVVIRSCRYIDLDFMCGLKSTYQTINSYVRTQTFTAGKDITKFITFTSSNRNDGGEDERLRVLKQLLYEAFAIKIERFNGGAGLGGKFPLTKAHKLHYCHQRNPIIIDYGTVIDIQIITYSDSNHPMLSVLVVYQ